MQSQLRLGIFLLLFVFTSCSLVPQVVEGTKTASSTITAFPLSSTTPFPLFTITPTTTPSPSISPTKKIFPTLSGLSANEVFRNWLSGSPDCILPCWAGIEPGKTSWEDARYQLATVVQIDMATDANCRFGRCGYSHWSYYSSDGTYYGGLIFSKDNILYSIYLDGDFTPEMNVKKILETYGQPAQVFIEAAIDNRGDPPILVVAIFYPKFNFIVKYLWWAEVRKDKIVACGQPNTFYLGVVATDESQWTEQELAANGDQFIQTGSIWSLRPIADVTDMTVTDFYKQGIQNVSGDCLSTPAEYWP